MRTKFGAAVVLTVASTGCPLTFTSSNPPPPDTGSTITENPPAPAARVASYDVVVGSQTVRVVPHYEADVAYCVPTGVEVFPLVGECTTQSDAISTPCGVTSDVSQVSIDGVAATPDPQTQDAAIVVNTSASSVLRLDGAFGTADIPLHASGLPTPTITTTPTASGVDIAWTTDVPAASSLVEITSGLVVDHCQVAQQTYTVDGQPISIRVQPFLQVETHQTPYGQVRVWRGNGKATQ
ncbi:MAG: hypothetical protein H0T79_06475 [Deltaproteobacteria bacterium]|nr:hypothetical protein [Deltaproteobacteria bacterium]